MRFTSSRTCSDNDSDDDKNRNNNKAAQQETIVVRVVHQGGMHYDALDSVVKVVDVQ